MTENDQDRGDGGHEPAPESSSSAGEDARSEQQHDEEPQVRVDPEATPVRPDAHRQPADESDAGEGARTDRIDLQWLIRPQGVLLVLIALLSTTLLLESCHRSNQVIDVAKEQTVLPGSLDPQLQLDFILRERHSRERIIATSHVILFGALMSILGGLLLVMGMLRMDRRTNDRMWPLMLVPGTLIAVLGVFLSSYAVTRSTAAERTSLLETLNSFSAKYVADDSNDGNDGGSP